MLAAGGSKGGRGTGEADPGAREVKPVFQGNLRAHEPGVTYPRARSEVNPRYLQWRAAEGRGEGHKTSRGSRKPEGGSRKQEPGWLDRRCDGGEGEPRRWWIKKGGSKRIIHWRKRMMGGAWHGVVIRIWGGGSRCSSCNSGTPSDAGMGAARRVGTNEGEMSKAR